MPDLIRHPVFSMDSGSRALQGIRRNDGNSALLFPGNRRVTIVYPEELARRTSGRATQKYDCIGLISDPTVGSEIIKQRPCVLLGMTPINDARRTVLVLPLSSSGTPRPPLAIEVEYLGRNVLVVCDQLRAIDKSSLH